LDSAPALSSPIHTVQIAHRIGSLDVDVSFTITKPWTILFGPSGSGKTTMLRAIAGLLRPDHGRIVTTTFPGSAQETIVVLLDTGRGLSVPAHKRLIRLAPQQPSLFPHLTVLKNLQYGHDLFGHDRMHQELLDRHIDQMLDAFRIRHLAEKRPGELSGGEARRVTLARARAATGCRLLLLDEPFTGMDAPLRDDLIPALRTRHDFLESGTTLSVTHDVAEAFQLNAEVIKIADGKVIAQGPVEIVLAEERHRLLQQLNR
jgi:molybdate transport system ATP-binding protein